MMELGSEKLYADARGPKVEVAERIELPVPDEKEYPTVLPPTLDKLVHGYDTAPEEEPWLATQDAPPKETKESARVRRQRRKAAKAASQPPQKVDRREIVSILFDIAGMIAISTGFWLIRPWCGLIALGVCLILMGWAITRNPNGDT